MAKSSKFRLNRCLADIVAFLLFFITGLALSRLLYEAAFPRLLLLAHPLPALLVAVSTALLGWFGWFSLNKRLQVGSGWFEGKSISVWALVPLIINVSYLFNPVVDLLNSRLLFAAAVWLSTLFLFASLVPERSWSWLGVIFIISALLPIYLATIPNTVGTADTFEFQVVIPQMGIAHPTGYPLYILIGRLFTLIPVGSMAWRVNLASLVFALLATIFLFFTTRHLLKHIVPAVLAAVILGLTPIFWSQAIEAEVYALHALFVAMVIWLMTMILMRTETNQDCANVIIQKPVPIDWTKAIILLAFFIGLGLANHLTTIFLLPPALLTIFLVYRTCLHQQSARENGGLLLKAAAAFSLPLLLYAYLPLRWSALHEEAMGVGRFAQWVFAGRFQGALQLTAWLTDLTRYRIIGRLLLQNWGWINLSLIILGFFNLFRLNWRVALVLLITWLGFVFYALNYYVPDLAVFIIPSHVVMAVFWAAGLAAIAGLAKWLASRLSRPSLGPPLTAISILIFLWPSLNLLSDSWAEMAAKGSRQLLNWGIGVLDMPLDTGAAILADSEKIAPLYYLQQAEGVRPDLDIMVLPDETAYRSELNARVQAGQTVYLARFLPGLAGVYHLRSVGPLIEVSLEPLQSAPAEIKRLDLEIGPLELVGLEVRDPSPVDAAAADVTLYWLTDTPLAEPFHIYLRWVGDDFVGDPFIRSGQHPAGNSYPTVAWQADEIISDFYLLPHPIMDEERELELQVAVGPPFQPADQLSWTTVTSVSLPPTRDFNPSNTLRAQNGPVLLSGVEFPSETRPEKPITLILTGYGAQVQDLQIHLRSTMDRFDETDVSNLPAPSGFATESFTYTTEVDTSLPNGRYYLFSQDPQIASICGWLAQLTTGCFLGEVDISGVALPNGAANYDDKIGLLEIDLPQRQLQPGSQLAVNLRWQSLSRMGEDYTLFIQLLDAQDRIISQVDAWPVQGTYPTSQWNPGEIVEDPYLLQLPGVMPSGSYRLHIGWYLLSTLERLPLVDENGLPIDDKIVIDDLVVP